MWILCCIRATDFCAWGEYRVGCCCCCAAPNATFAETSNFLLRSACGDPTCNIFDLRLSMSFSFLVCNRDCAAVLCWCLLSRDLCQCLARAFCRCAARASPFSQCAMVRAPPRRLRGCACVKSARRLLRAPAAVSLWPIYYSCPCESVICEPLRALIACGVAVGS